MADGQVGSNIRQSLGQNTIGNNLPFLLGLDSRIGIVNNLLSSQPSFKKPAIKTRYLVNLVCVDNIGLVMGDIRTWHSHIRASLTLYRDEFIWMKTAMVFGFLFSH